MELNEKILKVGIGVIIKNENKILLGHRCKKLDDTGGIYEPDTWTLPGGKQEFSETMYKCAIRETKEETNLDIMDVKLFGAEDDISSDRHFITLYMVTSTFKNQLKVMEPSKINEWKWFDIDNLPSNLYSPSEKELKRFLELQKK